MTVLSPPFNIRKCARRRIRDKDFAKRWGPCPPVPAGRTLEGVRAGRDEALEAALERLSRERE